MATSGYTSACSFLTLAINADESHRLLGLRKIGLSGMVEKIVATEDNATAVTLWNPDSYRLTGNTRKLSRHHDATQQRKRSVSLGSVGPQSPIVSLITISELSGVETEKNFASQLTENIRGKWQSFSYRLGQRPADTILTAFNTELWESEDECFTVSDMGRYLLTKLRMKANGMILANFSVHLPYTHENDRFRCYDLLKKAIDGLCKGTPSPDLIMIGGDWNMEPDDIRKYIARDVFLAFENSDGSTSRTDYPIDNFALIWPPRSRLLNMPELGERLIMRNLQDILTKHAPILAEVRLAMTSEPEMEGLSNQMANVQLGTQHSQWNNSAGQYSECGHPAPMSQSCPPPNQSYGGWY